MFTLGDRGTASRGPVCIDPNRLTEWSEWNEWSGCKPEDEQADKEPEFARIGFCEFGFQTRERSRLKDYQIEHDKQQVICVGPQSNGYLKCVHALRLAAHDPFDWFNDHPFYYDDGVVYYDFYPQFEGKWPVGGNFKHD